MEPWHHERLMRPGRRQSDRRTPAADNRRVLLVGPDDAWRLLTALVFEEAGYAAYAAADQRQAVAFTTRLLPDVVVVQMEASDTLAVLARLSEESSTFDIPVVVLTSSLPGSLRCSGPARRPPISRPADGRSSRADASPLRRPAGSTAPAP